MQRPETEWHELSIALATEATDERHTHVLAEAFLNNIDLNTRLPRIAGLVAALSLIALCVSVPARASTDSAAAEYEVKLAYLYNFTKFIRWPDSAFTQDDSPFKICIDGDLPRTRALAQLTRKKVSQHPIIVKLISADDKQPSCHIAYLTRRATPAPQLLKHWHQQSTLVVGETHQFAKLKGDIEFSMNKAQQIKLVINLGRIQTRDLTIGAQLLEIAETIYRDPEARRR